jgi:hypothetical protein
MLFFPYQAEPVRAAVPPSLPPGTTARWRPLVPVRVIGPSGQSRSYTRAVFDPCADDTVLALSLATLLGIPCAPPPDTACAGTGSSIRFGSGMWSWNYPMIRARFGAGRPSSASRQPRCATRSSEPVAACSSSTLSFAVKTESWRLRRIVRIRGRKGKGARADSRKTVPPFGDLNYDVPFFLWNESCPSCPLFFSPFFLGCGQGATLLRLRLGRFAGGQLLPWRGDVVRQAHRRPKKPRMSPFAPFCPLLPCSCHP